MDTTARLLRRDAHGHSSEGFGAAYRRVAPQVALWAALHVSPRLRRWIPLEDFLQEIWARAFAAYPTFDPQAGSFRGWLRGICNNVLREQLRKLRSRPSPIGGDEQREPKDPQTTVVSAASRTESRAILLAAVDALEEDERRLVAWRGLDGLPYREIGQRLGISGIAAESRWRRLLRRLQSQLPHGLLSP